MSDPQQPYGTPPQQGQQQHAGQQYAGQQHLGPQHAGTPYPGQQPGSAAAPLGRFAFIIALVSLGVGFIVTLSYPLIIRALSASSAIGVFGAIGNGLVFVMAIAALVLGLMSVRRPGSQVLGGIAIGIAAAQITGIVISWVSNLFYALSF